MTILKKMELNNISNNVEIKLFISMLLKYYLIFKNIFFDLYKN